MNFFQKRYFHKRKKKLKHSYGFEKSINSFQMENNIVHLIIYWTFCCYKFFNNISALLLLCKNNVHARFDMGDFFSDFCYIAKYWNFNRTKLLVKNVRAIRTLKFYTNNFKNVILIWLVFRAPTSLIDIIIFKIKLNFLIQCSTRLVFQFDSIVVSI